LLLLKVAAEKDVILLLAVDISSSCSASVSSSSERICELEECREAPMDPTVRPPYGRRNHYG